MSELQNFTCAACGRDFLSTPEDVELSAGHLCIAADLGLTQREANRRNSAAWQRGGPSRQPTCPRCGSTNKSVRLFNALNGAFDPTGCHNPWHGIPSQPSAGETVRLPSELSTTMANGANEPYSPPATAGEKPRMTNEQIKHMVERFLQWRLPENFNPDGGISFKLMFNEHTNHPMKHEPVGTNLFDYTQTEEMVRYMIEGLPVESSSPPATGGPTIPMLCNKCGQTLYLLDKATNAKFHVSCSGATAGTAREFFPIWLKGKGRLLADKPPSEHAILFAEAYAAEQVRQAENRARAAENDLMRISKAINQPGTHIVPIADRAIKVIAELRQERDALKKLAGEIEDAKNDQIAHMQEANRQMWEARVRAERALREARDKRDQEWLTFMAENMWDGAISICKAQFLKSSEGAK